MDRVYVMRETDTGLVKIGVSYAPRRRRVQLRKERGGDVELIAHRKHKDAYKVEAAAHYLLQDAAVSYKGEWFNVDLPIAQHVLLMALEHPEIAEQYGQRCTHGKCNRWTNSLDERICYGCKQSGVRTTD